MFRCRPGLGVYLFTGWLGGDVMVDKPQGIPQPGCCSACSPRIEEGSKPYLATWGSTAGHLHDIRITSPISPH